MSQAHLDLIRDSARSFPVVSDPDAVRSARVWYCKYKSREAALIERAASMKE
jgi:hypothetical protein